MMAVVYVLAGIGTLVVLGVAALLLLLAFIAWRLSRGPGGTLIVQLAEEGQDLLEQERVR